MIYRLKYDDGVEAVHNAMPQAASEALTEALAAACDDPLGATVPYNDVDDGVMRMILLDQARAVLFVGQTWKTLTVLEVTYFG
jgi:hypothetical protein